MALGYRRGRLATFRPDSATGEVIRLDVDATPQPRLARLARGIEVGRPFEWMSVIGPASSVSERALLVESSVRSQIGALYPWQVSDRFG
jgi:hypothetical protein